MLRPRRQSAPGILPAQRVWQTGGMSGSLHEYELLRAKVDAKVAEITARQAAQLACDRGCHACCAPGLTVAAVEAAAIAAWRATHPEAVVAGARWGATRCAFLAADGACAIYPVRPLVCRTQGLPIALNDGQLTACTLNFRDGLTALPAGDRLDQKTLSTLLFVVDQRFGGGARRPLTPDGL